MRTGAYLDQIRSLPVGNLQDLVGQDPFAILSPHPDDETLGAGGLIARACAANQAVEIVMVTDGSQSHPNSKAYPAHRLTKLRYAEAEEATRMLGVPSNRLTFLGLADTLVPDSGPVFEAAVDRTLEVLKATNARSLFVTWECDPHCDHQASAKLAKAVRKAYPGLQLWAYPIWGWHLGKETEIAQSPPRGYRIDIAGHLHQKRAAIAAHVSQVTDLIDDDSTGFRFSGETLAPFLQSFEYFIEVPA